MRERAIFRLLHLVLSIPIIGAIYGPVMLIPRALWFTRWISMPLVVLSGLWMWLKPRIVSRARVAAYKRRMHASHAGGSTLGSN
jgi:hypothetical protein